MATTTARQAPPETALESEWMLPAAYAGIYTELFWRAYLGRAYELWQVLIATQRRLRLLPAAERRWPPVYQMAAYLGCGTRHTVTGRAATLTHPGQGNLLDTLARERLAHTWAEGAGRQRRYSWDVREEAPTLTPYQVSSLPLPLQDDHAGILRQMFPAGQCRRWHQIGGQTLVPILIAPLPLR